jgi:hypothetical protein
MDNGNNSTTEAPIAAQHPTVAVDNSGSQKKVMIGLIIAVVLLLAILIGGLIFLLTTSTDTVARVRDIFIIFMALESLLIGVTLVILIIQMARLINLLQNEVKPILDSTNETVSNLRGTTAFLSDNLVEPVIKLNEYMAGLSQALQVLGLARKRPKP